MLKAALIFCLLEGIVLPDEVVWAGISTYESRGC